MALSPLPFLFRSVWVEAAWSSFWYLIIASFAAIAAFSCGLTLFQRPFAGKLFGGLALVGCFATIYPWLSVNPFAALSGAVALIGAYFALVDFRIKTRGSKISDHEGRCLQRARCSALAVPFMVILNMAAGKSDTDFTVYAITASSIISQILFIHWAIEKKSIRHLFVPMTGFVLLGSAFFFSVTEAIPAIALFFCLLLPFLLPRSEPFFARSENWWEVLLNHPARVLLSTFLALCVFGTVLLTFPVATRTGAIDLVDAAFTSVSAVCVTGLIVLDTPNDFTVFGQFFILLLIQLGGLGIMSITTVALNAMGRRFSLKQERLLTSMTDTDHKDLFHSLATILKFTLIAEFAGAFLLTILFVLTGETLGQSLVARPVYLNIGLLQCGIRTTN